MFRSSWLQVQQLAAAGLADRQGAGQLRRQGNSGAPQTGRAASPGQQEDGGRRCIYQQLVHRHQPHAGRSAPVQPAQAKRVGCFCQCSFVLFCQQIVKILSLYTPVTEFEERVSPAFIAAVKVRRLELQNKRKEII